MYFTELKNEFWKQNGFKPFGVLDIAVYDYLIYQCSLRGWLNPFQLQTRDIEFHLSITRKQIGESKNRLRDRGLINFTSGSRKESPTYMILGLNNNMFLTETQTETQLETYIGTYSETQTETQLEIPPKESSPTPPKEYTPKELDDNNKILLTRTREEADLDRFDSLLQEIADGGEQIWVDQMRKKHGIDDVVSILPLFRDHVIANSKLHEVSDINGFKRYFNVAFRYFSEVNPIETLTHYESASGDEKFKKFCKWIAEKAPNVSRELMPLTEDELYKLTEVYGSDMVFKTILDLNNRKDLLPKYYSLFRTLKNWLEKDNKPI